MNPIDDHKPLISDEGPINRRTALLQQRQREAVEMPSNPDLVERVMRAHRRNAMGEPLADQLTEGRSKAMVSPTSGLKIATGVGIASGVVAGLLGVIQSSPLLLSGGVLISVGGMAGLWWLRRHEGHRADLGTPPLRLFDAESLNAFDRVVDKASGDLGEAAVQRLTAIKSCLVRMASHVKSVDEHFTQDDRLYLRECVRRYIPDTLEAFLRVPRHQRHLPLVDGQSSADDTLLRQLGSLQTEIAQREKQIGRSAAEGLMKQERFLESKKSR